MSEPFTYNNQILRFAEYPLIKKITSIIKTWILFNLIALLFTAFFESDSHLTFNFFLGVNVMSIFYCISMFLLEPLNKHYKMYDLQTKKLHFEGEIILILINYIGLSIFLILIVESYGSLMTGLGIALTFIFPSIVIFIRRKTCFNEKSIELDTQETLVLGYNPQKYRGYAIICGAPVIVLPFYCLDFFATSPERLIIILIWLVIGFIIINNYLKPDKWNKKVSFEIKTYKGFRLYTLIYIIISILFGLGLIGIFLLIGV